MWNLTNRLSSSAVDNVLRVPGPCCSVNDEWREFETNVYSTKLHLRTDGSMCCIWISLMPPGLHWTAVSLFDVTSVVTQFNIILTMYGIHQFQFLEFFSFLLLWMTVGLK